MRVLKPPPQALPHHTQSYISPYSLPLPLRQSEKQAAPDAADALVVNRSKNPLKLKSTAGVMID